MEFARRGRGHDDVDDRNLLIHLPPPHVDPMLVIREALLSQLQKDRLRQEIIQAELAKIEHAMVLRNGSRHGIATDDVEWTKPVPFTFREQSMPPWQWSVIQECYVDVDEVHDPKQKEGKHKSVAKSEKPAMEDGVGECLRPCCCNGKADQENSKLEEQKSQKSSETILPEMTSPSVKWELTGITMPVKKRHKKLSCEMCQVQATSGHSLQEHCAGRKHRSKEASSQKTQLTEESSSRTGQKTSSIKWSCSTCQVNGASESDLKEHLNGRTHQQNIDAPLMEGGGMANNNELPEPECHKSNAPQHLGKPPSMFSSAICLANDGTSESDLKNHLNGRTDKQNIEAQLIEDGGMANNNELREPECHKSNAPQHLEKPPSMFSSTICLANDGTGESDLKEHLNGRTNQRNMEAQLMEGGGMASNNEVPEPECHKSNAPQHLEKPPSMFSSAICPANSVHELELGGHLLAKLQALLDEISNMSRNSEAQETTVLPNSVPQIAEQTSVSNCGIFQADSDCQLDLEHQIGSKTHQLNVQDLHEEAKNTGDFPPEIAKNQKLPSGWDCVVCQAKCYSESQFVHHCSSKKHQKKMDALKGGVNVKSNNLMMEKKVASNGSDSNSLSSEKVEEQAALWSCGICNLQCSSESMLAGHCEGEEHMEKQKLLVFCEVCNLQCNSEKMLAHHLSGNKHQKRLNANKRNAVVVFVRKNSNGEIVQ